MRKKLMLLLLVLLSPTIALATHETSFNLHLQSLHIGTNLTSAGVDIDLDIFSTETCSGSPLFTGSCVTDINGVCDIQVTMNTSYNQIMYACIYANSTLLSGCPSPFRAGQGQITDEDVDFTDLNVTNNLHVGSNVTAQYFIGDGSKLTNLPTLSQYWSRIGAMLYPTTFGDSLNLTNGWIYWGNDYFGFNNTMGMFQMSDDLFVPNVLSASAGLFGTNVEIQNDLRMRGGYIDLDFQDIAPSKYIRYNGGTDTIDIYGVDTSLSHNLLIGDDNKIVMGSLGNITADSSGSSAIEIRTTQFNIMTGGGDTYTDGNIYADGTITAGYFVGDGSQLTNLPAQPQYWNRTGTMLYPATSGDSIGLPAGYFISLNYPTNTKTLLYNSTTAQFEFNDTVYAPDFKTSAKVLDNCYEPYFRITGGSLTASLGIDTANQRRIYNRFTAPSGGSLSHTGYSRNVVCDGFSSWNTTGSVTIWIRASSTSLVTFNANMYYDGVIDGAINGTQNKQVAVANTWEKWTLQPATTPTANQKVNLEVTCTTALNGATCDMSDIEIWYYRDKF